MRAATSSERHVPLSFSQERIWLSEAFAGGGRSRHMSPVAIRVRGPLGPERVVSALDAIVRRHDALRMRYDVSDGSPVQFARSSIERTTLVTASHVVAVARTRVDQWLEQDFSEVAAEPSRLEVVADGSGDTIILWLRHQLVADGWSIGILLRELGVFLTTDGTADAVRLPAAPQYSDMVLAERRSWAESGGRCAGLEYWEHALRGLAPAPSLGGCSGGRPGVIGTPLPAELMNRVTLVARSRRTTPFAVLLAALKSMMASRTGDPDVCVGTVVAGRRDPATHGVVGLFTNTVPLRTALGGCLTNRDVLTAVAQTVKGAHLHDHVPYLHLVRHLQPSRIDGRPAWFRATLVYQAGATAICNWGPRLDVSLLDLNQSAPDTDLVLFIAPGPDGAELTVQYSAAERPAAEWLTRTFGDWLHEFCRDLEGPARMACRDTASAGSPPRGPLAARWHETASKHGSRIALKQGSSQVTFSELDAHAREVHALLEATEVRPGQCIAVAFERSVDFVGATLGVLRAACVVAIIPPSAPRRWREAALDRAQPVAVLTPGDAASASRPHVRRTSAAGPATDPGLAFITFSSGSSGTPSAVALTSRGLLNRVDWMARFEPWRPDDVACARTPLAFVDAITELLSPLLAGVTCVLLEPSDEDDVEALVGLLEREQVTRLVATPSLLRTVTRLDLSRTRLRVIVSSGEPLTGELARALRARIPFGTLLNLYGSSECTGDVTAYRVGDEDAAFVSLGEPIDGVTTILLDPDGLPVQAGGMGVLHVGGVALARGYYRDPRLTAERFVPSPLGHGERLLRTGDLARQVGPRFEHVGRADRQVKVRGQRLELDALEVVLLAHPGVAEATADVCRDAGGDVAVIVHVVPREEGVCTPAALKEHLLQSYPRSLLPGRIEVAERLPRLASGKIDRKLVRELATPAKGVEPPVSAAERLVQCAWTEALLRDDIGWDVDFFDAGGHSLLAMRVVAAIRERAGVALSLRSFVECRTMRALARLIERQMAMEVRVPLEGERLETGAGETMELTELQQAYWTGRVAAFDVSGVATHVYLEAQFQDLDLPRAEESWNRLIQRHEALRLTVTREGRQRVLTEVPRYVLDVTDLHGVPSEEADSRLLELRARLSHQVLDPEKWPLFDVRAALLPSGGVRLFFSLDLLVADGWGIRVLLRDWSALMDPGVGELEPLRSSYSQYVAAAREHAATTLDGAALEAFRVRVAELPSGPQLPLRMAPEAVSEARFVRREFRLERGDALGLAEAARHWRVTVASVALSAYMDVLGGWSETTRFMVNVPHHNRRPLVQGFEEIVGQFSNSVLVEADLQSPTSNFAARTQTVHARLWSAMGDGTMDALRVTRLAASHHGSLTGSAWPIVMTIAPPGRNLALGASRAELLFSLSQTSQVWLDNMITESADGLMVMWDAVEQLFDPAMLDDMFAAYGETLTRMARDPEAWSVPGRLVLPAAQLARRREFNATDGPVSEDRLDEAPRRHALGHAGRAALVAPDRRLTWGELRERSDAMAAALVEAGVGPGDRVALGIRRGVEQIVAAHAVLAAGGAYVPFDASVPQKRAETMLAKCEARVAVVERSSLPAWSRDLRLVFTDAASARSPARRGSAHDTAYVLFTSGSTGEPKGVEVTHRSALNTIDEVNGRFAVGPEDVFFAHSSLSFDLSVYDVFGAARAGALLVVPDEGAVMDPRETLELAREHRVSIWNSVPLAMQLLLEELERQDQTLPHVRLILMSGDWIPVSLVARIRRRLPRATAVGLGGPTEASIWCALHVIEDEDAARDRIPYGFPLRNHRLHVLDESLQPRPDGVAGEIFIGGVGLARGYVGDPVATAAAFIEHPATGERLYRSGDWARHAGSEGLQFLGRTDGQVKVRGHRIEVAELERLLRRVPGVRGAVVASPMDGRGERRLVAWLEGVAADLEPILRDRIAAELPAYMMPHAFTFVDALPTTERGKVDRARLAGESASLLHVESPVPEADCTDVLAILGRVFVGTELGAETNLLRAGFDSVDILRAVNAIEAELTIRPNLRAVFRDPTPRALAQAVAEARAATREDEAVVGSEARAATLPPPDPDSRATPMPSHGSRRVNGSCRTFSRQPVPWSSLVELLAPLCSFATDDGARFRYASAGALHSVDVYLYVGNSDLRHGPLGTFRLDRRRSELVSLDASATIGSDIHVPLVNAPMAAAAAFSIFLVADLAVIRERYVERHRDFALLEAGAMAQILRERAGDVGLGLCQVGAVDFDSVRALFLLHKEHACLTSFVGGIPDAAMESMESGLA